MKLISRKYLDYNATSPLSKRVCELLGSGDFLFANPASPHSSGKESAKTQNEISNYLLDTFNLSKTHQVFFHSGATEAINTFFQFDTESVMVYAQLLPAPMTFFFQTR